jgi:uncharacterized protein (TIGR02001 family)
VIARAAAAVSPARGTRTSLACLAATCIIACFPAAPAAAQIGATASIFSDARFRGLSLSEGRPVAILDVAYDDPSGFYGDVAASGVLRRGGDPAPLGVQLTGGYATDLASGTTLDFGITHSTYGHYSNAERGKSYSEIYAGIARGGLSSRLFLSPHYFEPGRWTAYGEVDGNVSPAPKWSIEGHVGVLATLRHPAGERYSKDFDWRVGVTRELGRLSLHAAWSDGVPGHDRYAGQAHSRSSVTIGASYVL